LSFTAAGKSIAHCAYLLVGRFEIFINHYQIMADVLKFPKIFLWGAAPSPTQVEGPVVNEWTDYVAAVSRRLF
jgi:hypothetical protein